MTYEEFMACGDRERREIFHRLAPEERCALLRTHLTRAAAVYRALLSAAQLTIIDEALELVRPDLYRRAPEASERAASDRLTERIRALFDRDTARQIFTLDGQALPEA